MTLKKKFFLLAVWVGVLLVFITGVGLYMSSKHLEESIQQEMRSAVASEGMVMDQWLHEKLSVAEHLGNILTAFNGDMSVIQSGKIMALGISDKDVADVAIGCYDGYFAGYKAGAYVGKDPTSRGWYKQVKAKDAPMLSDVYVDLATGKLTVSPTAPFKANGQFIGAVCVDVYLDVLKSYVEKINYRGQGRAIIISGKKEVLATTGPAEVMSDASAIEGFGPRLDECFQKGEGSFEYSGSEGDAVFSYVKLPTTGWLVGITASKDFVYGPLYSLQKVYAGLGFLGFLLIAGICFFFANSIVAPTTKLKEYAVELSSGNMAIGEIEVKTRDEVGQLAEAFNRMSESLHGLISRMAQTSTQVAASSEELTASAQQSADMSVQMAETVASINGQIDSQMDEVRHARDDVNRVFEDIKQVGSTTEQIKLASDSTAAAAREGSVLMDDAMNNMDNIERSVQQSMTVIQKLESGSQEIGRAIEAISSIAEQTNLLALNAAIEAARAGEAGRGFSVVAEEVRKLAEESKGSAIDISKRIETVLADIASAVESMQKEADEVKNGTSAIRTVGKKFGDIIAAIEDIQGKMQSMNDNVQRVTGGAEKIVSAVENISDANSQTAENLQHVSSSTQEQSASNEEIAAASHALANLAMEMQNEVNKFKF